MQNKARQVTAHSRMVFDDSNFPFMSGGRLCLIGRMGGHLRSSFTEKMKPVRDISLTIFKAAIVTVAVVLGFWAGSALGIPAWLQGVCLVPAMLLFYRLSGEHGPSLWKLIGFAAFISLLAFLASLGSKYVPEPGFWYWYLLIFFIAPIGPILNWFERRFFPKEHKSEPGTGQPAAHPVEKPEGGDQTQPQAEGNAPEPGPEASSPHSHVHPQPIHQR